MHAQKTTNEEQTGMILNITVTIKRPTLQWHHHPTLTGFVANAPIHKNEGSSDPGPCHFCQTPHQKRKAVVVSVPTPRPSSAKSVCTIRQPSHSSCSAIDLSTSPAKPVCNGQPARSSGSVIDLWSAPNGALASASVLPAKPVFGLSSGGGIVIDIAGIEAEEENRVLADQNHALAIVVGQMKSREIEAAHRCRALEESRDLLYSDYWSQRDVINDLQARLANNNADLFSELQEMITSLEEAAEEASWTDWRQSEEIRRLEGIVDSENISRMEESIDLERSRICKLREENCRLSSEVGRLQYQLNNMRASPPVGETATGVDNYLSDDNLSLFSSSDDNGSN